MTTKNDIDSLIQKYKPTQKDGPSVYLNMRMHDRNYEKMVDNLEEV